MASKTREQTEAIDHLNAVLTKDGVSRFKLDLVAPSSLKLLEVNARFMKKETFDVLTRNIKNLGLSSLPFCWWDGENYHVLSGNHRVQSAIAAGVELIMILYSDRAMPEQERITIQLSHNQLSGQDNPQILRELWGKIEALEFKDLTGFDSEFFEKLPASDVVDLKPPLVKYKSVTLTFIEDGADRFKEAVEAIKAEAGKGGDIYLARFADFDQFFKAVLMVKDKFEIINTATAVSKMAEINLEKLAEEREAEGTKDQSS